MTFIDKFPSSLIGCVLFVSISSFSIWFFKQYGAGFISQWVDDRSGDGPLADPAWVAAAEGREFVVRNDTEDINQECPEKKRERFMQALEGCSMVVKKEDLSAHIPNVQAMISTPQVSTSKDDAEIDLEIGQSTNDDGSPDAIPQNMEELSISNSGTNLDTTSPQPASTRVPDVQTTTPTPQVSTSKDDAEIDLETGQSTNVEEAFDISPQDMGTLSIPFFSSSGVDVEAASSVHPEECLNYQTAPPTNTDGQMNRSVPNCCAICLSSYDVGDTVVWSSNFECPHVFHHECILSWLVAMKSKEDNADSACPCCRREYIRQIPSSTDLSSEGDNLSSGQEVEQPSSMDSTGNVVVSAPGIAKHMLTRLQQMMLYPYTW